MTPRHVAVLDIGKTNAKVVLVDLGTGGELAVRSRPNRVRPGPPWPHYDVDGHWEFLLDALGEFQSRHGVDAISVTTHGAAAAFLGDEGLAAPVLDYEHDGPDTVAAAYEALRPGFEETGSPGLPAGLNLGAQLHWQVGTDPGLLARTRQILTYPGYWGQRLTGVASCDVTSLGCHTDLWNPREGGPSALPERLGIAELLAPARAPAEVLGPVLPEVAERTGLAPGTPVVCGIHDSNASLLPHLKARAAPFGVVSTGTWVVCMTVGGAPVTLDPDRDTLVNVNAFGDPVPSARFMGGREHDLLLGGGAVEATPGAVDEVLAGGIMLLPAVVRDSGPFRGRTARWIGPEPAPGTPERAAAVAHYLAMMTAHALGLTGHRGPIVVEGPFARNRAFLAMLGAATGAPVEAMPGTTGTSEGAAMLVGPLPARPRPTARPVPADDRLVAHAAAWRRETAGAGAPP